MNVTRCDGCSAVIAEPAFTLQVVKKVVASLRAGELQVEESLDFCRWSCVVLLAEKRSSSKTGVVA